MARSKYHGRRVEILFPSEEEKKKLEAEADRRGVPTTKYILSVLLDVGQPARPAIEPSELQNMQEEILQLRQVVGEKELQLSQKEGELRALRGADLLQRNWDGLIDPALLKALQGGPVHDHRLLDMLHCDNPTAVKAIARQLRILEGTGVISRTSKGWTFKR